MIPNFQARLELHNSAVNIDHQPIFATDAIYFVHSSAFHPVGCFGVADWAKVGGSFVIVQAALKVTVLTFPHACLDNFYPCIGDGSEETCAGSVQVVHNPLVDIS